MDPKVNRMDLEVNYLLIPWSSVLVISNSIISTWNSLDMILLSCFEILHDNLKMHMKLKLWSDVKRCLMTVRCLHYWDFLRFVVHSLFDANAISWILIFSLVPVVSVFSLYFPLFYHQTYTKLIQNMKKKGT